MTGNSISIRPYKGLTPYDESDAPFFFGREAEREIITANLMASRLTLLYGPSGLARALYSAQVWSITYENSQSRTLLNVGRLSLLLSYSTPGEMIRFQD